MTLPLLDGVRAGATWSPDAEHTYRYALTRDWFPKTTGHVLWIMLNPSVASETEDDRTIRRCQKTARAWGYDGITVANLFGLRTPYPNRMKLHPSPVGEATDDVIDTLAGAAGIGLVVAAWGQFRMARDRAVIVADIVTAHRDLYCVGRTADGHPRHPLYVKGEPSPQLWKAKRS